MSRIGRALAVVGAGLTFVTSGVQAQTLFTGSGCSGNTFLFCASWTGTYVDATHLSLFVTNTSQNAPASNPFSAFTQVVLGNLTLTDPASMTPVVGWQYDPSPVGFNGFGLLQNNFGAITTNGINNALTGGNSQLYTFGFGSSIGTFAQAQTATAGVQLAIHDQGFSVAGCSSKGVLAGNTVGQNTSAITGCGTSVVPEPSTYLLTASGLAGVFAFARRRRRV